MKLDKYLKAPAWMRVRSPEQEDVIGTAIEGFENVDALKQREFSQLRESAMPYISEVVRDLDSRTEATVRGGIRVWNPETYARVMRNQSLWKKVRKWFFTSFLPI